MLEFKNFKKVSDDPEKAVLKHENGHSIQVVKKALSPALKKRLEALPLHQSDPQEQVQPQDSSDSSSSQQGPVTINIHNGSQAQPIVPPVGGRAMESQPPNPGILHNLPLVGQPDQQSKGVPVQPPEQPQVGGAAGAIGGAQASQDNLPQDPNADINAMPGGKEGLQAANVTQNALQKGYTREAQEYSTAAAQQALKADAFQAGLEQKHQDIDDLTHDILNGHIKPNDYLENMAVPKKIATAIGLILGGASAGNTGGPNPAMEFLNKQIDRNIDAQKANMSNKHNVLSALQRQYGNDMVAENMARAVENSVLANKVNAAAATTNSALAKAAALNATMGLKQQAAQYALKANLAHMQAGLQSPQGQGGVDSRVSQYLQAARVYDPKGAEEVEKRYIPGVGMANVPLEPKDREMLQKKTELQGLLQNARGFLDQSGKLGPILPGKKAEGLALQSQINLRMGELAYLTRFTPEENKIYKKSIPDLTGTHFTDSDSELLNGLEKANNTSLNTFYQQKGINQQASSSQTVKGADGKMYRKSPDGKRMILVK